MGPRPAGRPHFIGDWTQTVGSLIEEGATVWLRCECHYNREVDLLKLAEERGPYLTLWDRCPPCPSCGKAAWFAARRPDEGAMTTNLRCTSEPLAWTIHLHSPCPWCGGEGKRKPKGWPFGRVAAWIARRQNPADEASGPGPDDR